MGDWILKSSSGRSIRTFSLYETCEDIIHLIMWIWRDILVAELTTSNKKDKEILLILRQIRSIVGEAYYHEFLNTKNLSHQSINGLLPLF
jgi:hypothetical protein